MAPAIINTPQNIDRHFLPPNENGCIEWGLKVDKDGYGSYSINHVGQRAHRIVYERTYGEIPKGLLVRHKCHNRKCVNIEHLLLGTPQDNMTDMVQAGRSLTGERNHKAKLTADDVQKIKDLILQGYRTCTIAKIYNLNWSTVGHIKIGKNWAHLG